MPPKLTAEEKKALRAQKKAQKKLALTERKKQLKRDLLGREIQYSQLTIQKHEKEWRKLLIEIALPEIRADLEFAWHNFERVIDCKDFTISLLMDEIKDAEEQYMMSSKNHIENVDKLIDMFADRMEELKTHNDKQITKLRQRCEEEYEEIKSSFLEDENYLKTILYMLEVAKKEQKQNVRAEYFSKIEEEDNKNVGNIQRLRGILETVHSTLQTDIEDFLSNYRNQIKERKKEHDNLRARDEVMQNVIKKQLEKLRKTCEYIKILKQQMGDTQKLLERKLKDLEAEYDFYFLAFDKLKNRLISDRRMDFEKLNILTISYNKAVQQLETVKAKGEQILHTAAICRKLETLEEKILPFPIGYGKENVKITENNNLGDDIKTLELFWQRVAQAEASRYAINEEREYLKKENLILKMKLHQYCQCLNCPATARNLPKQIKHITEGVFEFQKYQKHQSYEQFLGTTHFIDDNYTLDEK